MLDRKAALNRVLEILSEKAPPDKPWAISESHLTETASAWIFFYNSRRYLETGEIVYALAGNGPVLVNKKTGEVKFYGSLPTVDVIINDYEKAMSADVY